MKILVIVLSAIILLINGCSTYRIYRIYNPENYLMEEPREFWSARENELCPVCGVTSRNVKSYHGSGMRETPFVYYYRCFRQHLWVMIEEVDKETIIEAIR